MSLPARMKSPFVRSNRLSEETLNYSDPKFRKSVHLPKGRILVTAGPRIVEIAGPERVRQLLSAPNVKIIRKRKTGAIVAIQLLDFGDNLRVTARYGNPQKLSHNAETPENPRRVWTLKRLEPHPGILEKFTRAQK
jgi:hypothetical protein